MNTLTTDKKYTVMVSAYRASNNALENMIDTERLYDRLEHHYHVHAIRAISVNPSSVRQVFIIHTNSSHDMAEIKRLALNAYHQTSVLVSNNRKHDIQLHDINACTTHIGHSFKSQRYSAPSEQCYTIINGQDYWSIK